MMASNHSVPMVPMPQIQKEPGTGQALFVCVSWVNCPQGPKPGHPLKVNAGGVVSSRESEAEKPTVASLLTRGLRVQGAAGSSPQSTR